MERITFMRHGDVDFNTASPNMLKDTLTLSEKGKLRTLEFAQTINPSDYDTIIISNTKRTRETAYIIAKYAQAIVNVEPLLNPWKARTDPSISYLSADDYFKSYSEFVSCNGNPKSANVPWESFDSLKNRTLEGIQRYKKYKSVLIITHSIVISCYTGITQKGIQYCSPQSISYDDLQCLPPDFISVLK